MPEAKEALKDLKRIITTPPILVAQREKEPLYLYVFATNSRRLCSRSFEVSNLVLRLKQKKVYKLASPWEGPFIITEVIGGEAYRLKYEKTGEISHNPWNVAQLRRFYA